MNGPVFSRFQLALSSGRSEQIEAEAAVSFSPPGSGCGGQRL